MGKFITGSVYVGLDVHKDSIDIAVAKAGREGEVRHVAKNVFAVHGLNEAGKPELGRLVQLHFGLQLRPAGCGAEHRAPAQP